MRLTSRTITSLLAAVGTGFAVSAMIGAPVAVAESCRPSQVWLNGECTYPPDDSGGPAADQGVVCPEVREGMVIWSCNTFDEPK
jgi:hypothetical protein